MKNIIQHKKIVYVLLIILFGLLAYSNIFHVPFHFDEKHNIVSNPIIKELNFFIEPYKIG
ncbi:MAG: hypothetical protein KAI96_00925 [Thermodesulfovibrionia bacterium]|nr:hypothetical protein [Thermodesulfovibrionia bacterium]